MEQLLQIKLDHSQLSFIRELRPQNAKYRIKLILHPQKGLIVRHAKTVSLRQIEDFLLSHQDWIIQMLQKKLPYKSRFSKDNFSLDWLGMKKKVTFFEHKLSKIKIQAIPNREEICIYLPVGKMKVLSDVQHPEYEDMLGALKKAIESWYKQQAHLIFPSLFSDCIQQCSWVKKMPKLTIKIQKTRWGSCSSLGNINLNASLVRFDREIIKSVIFHELCHLKYMNHSSDFYRLLDSVVPNRAFCDQTLKKNQSTIIL